MIFSPGAPGSRLAESPEKKKNLSMGQGRSGEFRSWRWLALACGLLFSGAAAAQSDECARLRAALAAPVGGDPAAAGAARKVRAELDQISA
jgi:hypothetical protein